MGYIAGSTSWRSALTRAVSLLAQRRAARPRRAWSILVPGVTAVAGLLLTVSATTSDGTDLRNDRRPELTGLIGERKREVASAQERAALLRRRVEARTSQLAGSDDRTAEQRSIATGREFEAGTAPLRGPGLTVRLDDSPRRSDGSRAAGATVDDLVVHQQDVQAVVNALWAGGAEAMMIKGVRVIATTAVRCVGNTLLLDGRVYSPPFVIAAIGDPGRLQRALDAAEGVRAFRIAVANYGLGYQVKVEADVSVPAYDGSTALRSARSAG